MLSVDAGENCLTVYRSYEQLSCSYIPWRIPWQRIEFEDIPADCDTESIRADEWVAVNLAADLALSGLSKDGVSPIDANFTTPDWVMHYE